MTYDSIIVNVIIARKLLLIVQMHQDDDYDPDFGHYSNLVQVE